MPGRLPKIGRAVLGILAISLYGLIALACDQVSELRSVPDQAPASATLKAAPSNRESPAQSSSTRLADAPERPPKIVAFGDSLTAGLGVAPEQTYPSQLQQRLDGSGYRVKVVNAGVSGETSAGGLRRVDWILKSDPSLVILELGGNDGLRGVDPDQTRGNLEQIIQRFQSADIPVVLAGMKLPPNYGEDFTRRFAAMYPDLARTYGLHYMPFFLEDVALNDHLTQADGIHPTGEGYRVIVDNLLPVLEPILAEIAPPPS